MNKKVFVVLLFVLFSTTSIAFCEDENLKDPPYLSGMPNYQVIEAADKEFDAYQFCDGKKAFSVEGKLWQKEYQIKEGANTASNLQITRNYANAVKSKGGTVLFDGACDGECWTHCMERAMAGKIIKGNRELWVEVTPYNDGHDYRITIVEKEAMKQEVSAANLFDTLNKEGHITLYINFDTGKSTIKPESQAIVNQIAEMMKSNPDLSLSVEGHTDNAGDPKSNKTLSADRAKAVVSGIVKMGVNAKRLASTGFGQDKPIADNNTEEGRAKNRRVELRKK
jgi:OOP family OmpA-OmpF porin